LPLKGNERRGESVDQKLRFESEKEKLKKFKWVNRGNNKEKS